MEQGVATGLGSERERILTAAREVIGERGYAEATAAEIVERARVGEDAFGALFGGKERCAVAVETAILAEVVAVVSSAYSPDRSEWDSAVRGVMAILELMAAKPSYARFGFIVARQEAPPSVKAIYENGYTLLTAMLERGWQYSGLETQPMRAALGALGGAEAVVRREIAAGRTEALPQLLPDLVYSAAVPFLGQEDALALARAGRELLRGTEWG